MASQEGHGRTMFIPDNDDVPESQFISSGVTYVPSLAVLPMGATASSCLFILIVVDGSHGVLYLGYLSTSVIQHRHQR